ncbi:MAG: ABC transporter substrate-binding protein, partial [Chloroflexi bacterium]|nr:ABC transporter substrate-binding protein [Chloroflexota bacterium]
MIKNHRNQWRLRSLITFFVLLAGVSCRDTLPPCQDELGCVNIRVNDPVQISAILALSGSVEPLGEESLQAIELAIADRGATLLDHEVTLQAYDSGCNEQMGQAAAQNVRGNEDILGVIGPNCSDIVSAIHPTIHNGNLVMVSPSATAPNLTTVATATAVSRQGSFFRTAANNLQQAQVAAEFAYQQLGLRTAVTI